MNRFFLILLIFSSAAVCAQDQVMNSKSSVWDLYGKNGNIVYKDYNDINFKNISMENLVIPENVIFSTQITLHLFTPQTNSPILARGYAVPVDKDILIDEKIKMLLAERLVDSVEKIKELTVGEVLYYTVVVAAKTICYEDIRVTQKVPGFEYPDYADSFLLGLGTCHDYASNMVKVFDWFKQYNQRIKNIFMLYVHDPTYNLKEEEKNSVLQNGEYPQSVQHAWNMLLIFDPEKLVYSFIDTTGNNGWYGYLSPAKVGQQLSSKPNVNLAKMYETIRESKPAYDLYLREYKDAISLEDTHEKISDLEKIEYLKKLIAYEQMNRHWQSLCEHISQLRAIIKDSATWDKSEYSAAYSLVSDNETEHNYEEGFQCFKDIFKHSNDLEKRRSSIDQFRRLLNTQFTDPDDRSQRSEMISEIIMERNYYDYLYRLDFQGFANWIRDSKKRKIFKRYLREHQKSAELKNSNSN
jgi:hypothetical protein